MVETLLSVENLAVWVQSQTERLPIVQSTSFSIRKGEIFGLVGESGSGKSMSLRAIMRLLPKQMQIEGKIMWGGRDLNSLSESAMRKVRGKEISMIFQDPMSALNPALSVGRQIDETLKAHDMNSGRLRKARAIELLQRVGIPSAAQRLDDYPHQFSGGMRQRAMIAIALASDPALILADEPTTALDVTIQDQILGLLMSLRDELGVSVALVTHDLGVVSAVCDRMSVMYAGEIMEHGDAGQVLLKPRHPYTLGLLNSIPLATAALESLQPIAGSPPLITARPGGCLFSPRCSYRQAECEADRPTLLPVGTGRASACLRQNTLLEEGVFA